MQKDIWVLLTTKWDFFGKLLLEHIEISLAAILIAIVFGGLVGILISAWLSDSVLRYRQCDRGHRAYNFMRCCPWCGTPIRA